MHTHDANTMHYCITHKSEFELGSSHQRTDIERDQIKTSEGDRWLYGEVSWYLGS